MRGENRPGKKEWVWALEDYLDADRNALTEPLGVLPRPTDPDLGSMPVTDDVRAAVTALVADAVESFERLVAELRALLDRQPGEPE